MFFIINKILLAEDKRINVLISSKENQIIDDLLKKISWSCSNNNFIEFMDCFTSKKASSIRKKAENAFICGNIDMEILNHFLISKEENEISFGVKYILNEDSKKIIFCSKIFLKNENGVWKIDSEDVRNSYFESINDSDWIDDLFVPEQQIVPANNENWRLPNPNNGGIESILPRDIMFVPGSSCAEGKCNIR